MSAQSSPKPVVSAVAGRPRDPFTLIKGGHQWSFSCEAGEEPTLLRRLAELASDATVPFDWFDAAMVSHQLSRRLKAGINRIEGGVTPTPTGVAAPQNQPDLR